MALKDEMFTLKEIALSAFKGTCERIGAEYKTIFYNATEDMENAKMFEGVFIDGKFFEFKVIKRRDRIDGERTLYVGSTNKTKNDLLMNYYLYVKKNYPILHVASTIDQVFITHGEVDYEITFVLKRGVSDGK